MDIPTILSQWQAWGVFDYVLPFLLIFAIVYGILNATNIAGKEKGVHIVIAVVIGLLALQFSFVPQFFGEIFPRFGVGISILLVFMILVGLFINVEDMRYWYYGLGGLGAVIGVIIVISSLNTLGYTGFNWEDNLGWILGGILLIGVVAAVSMGSSTRDGKATLKEHR